MPQRDKQKAKLFAVYRILYEHTDNMQGITMAEIIKRLEIEYDISAKRESILSDFLALETVFHICFEERGRPKTYHLTTREFSFSDLDIIINSIEAYDPLAEEERQSLIKKIRNLGSMRQGKLLHVSYDAKNAISNLDEVTREKLALIKTAIKEQREISFYYPYYTLSKEAVPVLKYQSNHLLPYQIHCVDGPYYLTGSKSRRSPSDATEELRCFRVDKIAEMWAEDYNADKTCKAFEERRLRLESSNYTIHPEPLYHMPSQSEQNALMAYLNSKDTIKIEKISLQFDNGLINTIIDRFGANIEIKPIDESSSRITIETAITHEFIGWAFSLGTGARLLAPLYVAEKIKKWLKDVSKLYGINESS